MEEVILFIQYELCVSRCIFYLLQIPGIFVYSTSMRVIITAIEKIQFNSTNICWTLYKALQGTQRGVREVNLSKGL